MKSKALVTLLAAAALPALSGQILYHQQFDYDVSQNSSNFTAANFPDEGWTSGTGVITYQHAAGLTYPGLSPAATGGAMVYDFDGGTGGRSAIQTTTYLDYANFSAGQVFEFSGLMRIERAGFTSAEIFFNADQAVNRVTLGANGTNLFATAWMNGALTTVTGPEWSLNTTHALLMRVNKGTGTSTTNSLVEIWFDPDYSNLGTPFFSSTSDTRIGRDAGAYTSVEYRGVNIGDARVVWDEVQVYAIPEPRVYAALFGLFALGFVAWRRRRS